ncbi:hydroxymethylglutaryl-CoA lyase [Deltaproteobacteria bacterium TL4]
MSLPEIVRIVEVGARDGLQNEAQFVPTSTKVELINLLSQTGLKSIEAASFVSPRWVPQMQDSSAVMRQIDRNSEVVYSALTPNMRGLESALAAHVEEVAVFAAASDEFSQRNINCSIKDALKRFIPMIEVARQNKVKVRGYVSCVLGCPYAGLIRPQAVADVAKELYSMGCYEISLGDTIGVGNPLSVLKMIEAVATDIPLPAIAVHFHDTYGQALANIYAALTQGITIVDASVAGLGGCPYAKGATGNVASEDVVYLLNGLGIHSGVDLNKLIAAGQMITQYLGKTTSSKVAQALSCRIH